MPDLPLILCGPILRRCDEKLTTVWLATSYKLPDEACIHIEDVSGRVAVPIPTKPEKLTVQVGEKLFVNLLLARPAKGTFPRGKLLAYNVDLAGSAKLDWKNLVYNKPHIKMTFFLQGDGQAIRIMQGSCRKPYGMGPDALAAADSLISRNPVNLTVSVSAEHGADRGRPAVLFLTGDQIYADDVEEGHFAMIRALARQIMGFEESIPTGTGKNNHIKLDKLTYGKVRKSFTRNTVRFTTEDGEGHLLGLGEYAAMHLMVWNPTIWDPIAVEKLPGATWSNNIPPGEDKRKSGARVRDMHRTLQAVRRALADVPTYMIFDDHDVTDDWNVHADWYKNVAESESGRRVVAHALTAYWLFQGWGNDPDHFSPAFVSTVQDYCALLQKHPGGQIASDTPECKKLVDMLWDYHDWSFAVPTSPLTVFADMRTERELRPEGTGPILMNRSARDKLAKVASNAGHRPNAPLIIVSSAPVFNISGLNLGQDLGRYVQRKDLADLDFEQWSNNPVGKAGFLRFVIEKIQPSYCVFLSGEVHFGLAAGVDYYLDTPLLDVLRAKKVTHPLNQCCRFIQLTSSALKNENATAAKYLFKKGITDVIPFLDVNEPTWNIFGSPLGPLKASSTVLPYLGQLLWIEQGKNVPDNYTESYAPIEGHCNLGVVTVEPGSDRVVHDFCLIIKLRPFAPEILEAQAIVSSVRMPVFDPASIP